MPARRDPPLTIEEIIEGALALAEAESLDGLSMRALATKLGVSPMAVYHHVSDRDGLVALVADAVLARVAVPEPDVGWQMWLAAYHDALWDQIRTVEGLAGHLLAQPSTPTGAAVRRATVDLLTASGFAPRAALLAASTFHTHLLGRLALASLRPDQSRADEPEWHAHGLTASDYVADGLATIIAGIEAQHPLPRTGINRTGTKD